MWIKHSSVLFLLFLFQRNVSAEENAQTKIIGGHEAYKGQFKFPVSLRTPGGHICGGTLIRNDAVLTAAHCVYRNPNPASYRVGVDILWMHDFDLDPAKKLVVTKINIHKKYDADTQVNDIAVLKVQPLGGKEMNHTGIPIELNTSPIKDNTTCTVLGWGDTVAGTNAGSIILRYVNVPIVPKNNCSKLYGPSMIPANTICAGTFGKDSCQGDSGGPLICGGKLAGVVSFGIGCADVFPGVYTDVSKFTKWIKEVQNNAPQQRFTIYGITLTIIGYIISH